jgi:hypothetical protein
METELQFIERKCAADENNKLPIENEMFLGQLGESTSDIWKITRSRLTGL